MKTAFLLTALWLTTLTASLIGAEPTAMQQAIEADWLRQLEGPSAAVNPAAAAATWADAAGAVDGVKDGRYGFHTAAEPNPWWQVDLGRASEIARVVVFNRLDYAPGQPWTARI